MSRDIGKDRSQRADPQVIVIRNREVVLGGLITGQSDVASRLPGYPVAELRERLDELRPGDIPGKLHAAMTSSRT